MNKIITLLLALGFFSFSYIQITRNNGDPKYKPVGYNHRIEDAILTDNPRPFYQGSPLKYNMSTGTEVFLSDSVWITINEVSPLARTYYNLQSNGCPHYIWQDPQRLQNVHAVFMVDPVGASGFPDRRSKYFFSSDTANTWTYLGNVPSVRSGFPGISGFSDGTAAILNHTTDGGGVLRSQAYKDIAPGAGSFSRCDPGVASGNLSIWPHFVPTQNISQVSKLVFVSSLQVNDSAYSNVWTGFSPSCSFLGYTNQPGMEAADSYNLARSADGRIGVAYIGYLPVMGCVYFMESTNNGITFGTPVRLWLPNYTVGDSMGALRGVDMVYKGNTPCVVFSVCKLDGQGSYFPRLPSKTFFWSPAVNGGNAVLIDSAGGMNGSNFLIVYFSSCRPTIGTSTNDQALYIAWHRARNDTDALGANLFDVYFTYSTNSGANWAPRIRVTNNSGPLRDCKYASISPKNHSAGNCNYFAHLIFQSDSLPGSIFGMSLARMMYAKIVINTCPVGIQSNNNEIPGRFALYQNYPNPFNPVTKIKFSLPVAGYTKLIIYDLLGREVTTLVREDLKPGTYEVEWDATNYPSGVYYYKFTAGDYTETRKMVLIK